MLSKDTWYEVIRHLDIKDVMTCSLVNKQFNKICKMNKIWDRLLFILLRGHGVFAYIASREVSKYMSKVNDISKLLPHITNTDSNSLTLYQVHYIYKNMSNMTKKYPHVSFESFEYMLNIESTSDLIKCSMLLDWNKQVYTISKHIKYFHNLKEIFLTYLVISIIPLELYELSNLQVINLSNNKITNIHKEIGKLSNLKRLYLDWNIISNIPEEICQLTNLEILSIGGNMISQLPNNIGQLSNLKELIIYSNNISELPEGIGNLVNLEELIPVSYTHLTLPTNSRV